MCDRTSHVTYGSVMSSIVTYLWVMSLFPQVASYYLYTVLLVHKRHESLRICVSHVTCLWVTSRVNKSRPYSHITSYYLYAVLLAHKRHESRHICIHSSDRMSHVTYVCVMSLFHESRPFICTQSYLFIRDMSHVSYVWVTSHVNESCHICMSHVSREQGRDLF